VVVLVVAGSLSAKRWKVTLLAVGAQTRIVGVQAGGALRRAGSIHSRDGDLALQDVGRHNQVVGADLQRRQIGDVRHLLTHIERQPGRIARQLDALATRHAVGRSLQAALGRVAQQVAVGCALGILPGDGVLQHPVGALLVDVARTAAAGLRHRPDVGFFRICAL
jgi:hypothetical protein